MTPRIAFHEVAPDAYRALSALENCLHHSSLDPMLIHLVKLRASQINGCAYCIDMHAKDLLAQGETVQRIYGLDAWREAPYYTDRERAALDWTEAITLLADTHAEDALYDAARKHFSEQEIVDLTWVIAAINAWNRMAVAFRSPAGSYQTPRAATKRETV